MVVLEELGLLLGESEGVEFGKDGGREGQCLSSSRSGVLCSLLWIVRSAVGSF